MENSTGIQFSVSEALSGLTCLTYIQFVLSGLFYQQMNAHIQDYVSDKMDKKMKIFFYSAVSKIYILNSITNNKILFL